MREPRVIVTTSWDDGHPDDLRLADLLSELGLAATFYVPLRRPGHPVMNGQQIRQLATRFEVGAHGASHLDLRALPQEALAAEVRDCRRALEDIVGRRVEAFAYPFGAWSRRVREAVRAEGYLCARTTRPFRLSIPQDPWAMPVALHARNCRWTAWLEHCARRADLDGMRTALRFGLGRSWASCARALFHACLARGGVWHLWGHSWEIAERNLWQELRELLKYVAGRKDVGYLTNSQIASLSPCAWEQGHASHQQGR